MAILKPSPSAPSRFSAGTTTSWKATAEVSVARWPILSRCFSRITPGASIGITNAESPLWPLPGSVEAKHTIHAAWPAFVMNIFEPLTTYSSPRRTAVVWMPETSEPAPGSVSPKQPSTGASTSGPEPLLLLLLGARDQDRAGREAVRPDRGADARAPPVDLLPHEHPVEGRQLQAAERLRNVQVHQADLVRLGDDVRSMGLMLVTLGRARPDLLLRELARERAQLLLLVAEGERDAARDTGLDSGHRYAPGESID